MKTLGVIGGIGPLATAYFMELLVNITEAHEDQEHIDTIIYSRPSIPDRTSYILKKSKESPVNMMVDIGKRLQEQGASFITIPCITAHSFYKEIAEEIEVPIINALEELGIVNDTWHLYTYEEYDMLDTENLHKLKDLFSPLGETTSQEEEEEDEE